MELICTSCEARYQVPDGALGATGRRVTCTNCGHSWHAAATGAAAEAADMPELPTDEAADEASSDSAAAPAPLTADPARREQMAEIRGMLAEVQAPRPGPATQGAAVGDAPPPDDDESSGSGGESPAVRAAMATGAVAPAQLSRTSTAEGGPERAGNPALERRRVPPRSFGDEPGAGARARRADFREEDRSGTAGAFATGFLLVLIIAALMAALYVLQPQIVARFPAADPVLSDYVATVDGLRADLADAYAATRAWVMALLDRAA